MQQARTELEHERGRGTRPSSTAYETTSRVQDTATKATGRRRRTASTGSAPPAIAPYTMAAATQARLAMPVQLNGSHGQRPRSGSAGVREHADERSAPSRRARLVRRRRRSPPCTSMKPGESEIPFGEAHRPVRAEDSEHPEDQDALSRSEAGARSPAPAQRHMPRTKQPPARNARASKEQGSPSWLCSRHDSDDLEIGGKAAGRPATKCNRESKSRHHE